MPSSSTRDIILEIIQSRESETVSGLAQEFGLTPATVRRHLDILQRDGLVAFTEIRHGTGRPEFSFSLTERGHETLPKHYSEMLGKLISKLVSYKAGSLKEKSGDQILNEMLREMAQESVDLHGDANNGVPRLMEILRDQDFSPQLRENKGKVELSLMSCPFRSVAINNPSLCAYDIAAIEAVSASPVERIACLSNGDSVCKYLIGIRTSDGVSAI